MQLFNEFPPVSTEDWEEAIQKDLKGADYNKRLLWETGEGFKVKPYYRAEDLANINFLECVPGEFPFVRGNNEKNNYWLIRQDVVVTDPQKANKQVLSNIKNGINSINFVLGEDTAPDKNFISQLLKDIDTKALEINFTAGKFASLIPGLLQEINFSGSGSVDIDPLDKLNRFGKFCVTVDKAFDTVKDIMVKTESLAGFRVLVIHGDTFRNAGSGIVQELAYSLSMGAEYLTRLTNRGLKAEMIAPKMVFQFAIGSNYFMEIAKIRAARYLWAKILESYGVLDLENTKMCIHSKSAEWNKTIYDPYVNMLRSTTEAMSAIIGGTDSLTIDPFNKIYETPDDFSERTARNLQHLLKEESYLDKVIDPSAGSYYIETLTNSLIENAWDLFLKIDDLGGYLDALFVGVIQKDINETAIKRNKMIAERKEIILGTNQYPNTGEILKPGLNILTSFEEPDEEIITEPLRLYRGANAFEELRYKTDLYSAENKRPKVFMLTIGNLAMSRARSQFSGNFFGCAGFEIIDNNGFKTPAEGAKAALNSKAEIIVVCSSDEEYTEVVPEIHKLIKNNAILVVAGAPVCMSDLKAAGITNFINVKSNVLEELKRYQAEINIK